MTEDPSLSPWDWESEDASLREPPSSGWLAVRAFGLVLLLLAAVGVVVGFWLLVRALVHPMPYQDPSP